MNRHKRLYKTPLRRREIPIAIEDEPLKDYYKIKKLQLKTEAFLRRRADSNRCKSFCRARPSHSATTPYTPVKAGVSFIEFANIKYKLDIF